MVIRIATLLLALAKHQTLCVLTVDPYNNLEKSFYQ